MRLALASALACIVAPVAAQAASAEAAAAGQAMALTSVPNVMKKVEAATAHLPKPTKTDKKD